MAMQYLSFYEGTILNPLNDKKCELYSPGMLVVKGKGSKATIVEVLPSQAARTRYGSKITSKNHQSFGNSLILPGFFDMHFHWVQDDVRQMPKDSLLQWLEKYTFPTEQKFASKSFAAKKAKEFFKKLSSVGTVGGACYSSIHEHAVHEAMKNVKGDFLIGNVLMNMNSPKKLTQSEDDSLALTKKLISKYKQRHVFTPRFAITTTPKVMREGSKMADKAKCFKQTHLSETPGEIDFVLSLYRGLPGFEKVKSYTEIYQRTGMLGSRSLMGHGIHLSAPELKILRETKTVLVHCPTSNAPIEESGLGSGLFDFRKIERAKVRWALGSDIGGGPFLSMLDVMQSFVDQNQRVGIKQATYVKALYRATLAGAEILGVSRRAGNFSKGKELSFVVLPVQGEVKGKAENILQQALLPYAGQREKYENLVSHVCLRGEVVHGRAAKK